VNTAETTHHTDTPAGALHRSPVTGGVLAALATLYVVWGSTYLAIRVMVEHIPPLLGSAIRLLAAGILLGVGLTLLRGWCALRLRAAELAGSILVGLLVLGAAFGLLNLAERHIPSGLAALLVATVPLWVAILRITHRQRPNRLTLTGILIGFAGVGLVVAPQGISGHAPLLWLTLLLLAAGCEATGLFYSQWLPLPKDALLDATVQMLAAGAAQTLAGLAFGEPLAPASWPIGSLLGLAYLIGPGTILAYAAFVWLLPRAPATVTSTYAYVNPVVAMLLGATILGETLTWPMLTGGALIIGSVAVVLTYGHTHPDRATST
jgi:drug/metabolite transporter (DMT)-like permease